MSETKVTWKLVLIYPIGYNKPPKTLEFETAGKLNSYILNHLDMLKDLQRIDTVKIEETTVRTLYKNGEFSEQYRGGWVELR
jgi:hypothetical protein